MCVLRTRAHKITYSGPNCGRRGKFGSNYLSFRETPPKKKIKFKLSMDTEVFTPFKYAKNREKKTQKIESLVLMKSMFKQHGNE